MSGERKAISELVDSFLNECCGPEDVGGESNSAYRNAGRVHSESVFGAFEGLKSRNRPPV